MTATHQTVGLHVFRKHRERDILEQHEIEPAALDMLHLAAPLRAGKRDEQEGDRKQQDQHLGEAAPRRHARREFREHRKGYEPRCKFLTAAVGIIEQQRK